MNLVLQCLGINRRLRFSFDLPSGQREPALAGGGRINAPDHNVPAPVWEQEARALVHPLRALFPNIQELTLTSVSSAEDFLDLKHHEEGSGTIIWPRLAVLVVETDTRTDSDWLKEIEDAVGGLVHVRRECGSPKFTASIRNQTWPKENEDVRSDYFWRMDR